MKTLKPIGVLGKTVLFLLVIFGFVSVAATAQDATMADLAGVATKIKTLRNYSYQTENNATFPDGHKEKMTSHVYMDALHKRVCYKTDYQVLLLNDKWFFQADHHQKTASVFSLAKYKAKYKTAAPELEHAFSNNQVSDFMDSIIMKKARIISAKRNGDLTTFVLGFPANYYVKGMTVIYNKKSDLPESIKIISFYPMEQQGKDVKGTTYESVSKGYSRSVPEQVFDEGQYFRIQGGKAVLQQFKNYKLSAIL